MSCPGLHCPGCSGGQTLGIAAVAVAGLAVAYETVAVVAENIIPIAAVVAACLVLSVAASMWLERLSDRRGVAWGRARGIYSRADYIAPPRAAAGLPLRQPPPIVNVFNFYGDGTAPAAAIIRRAIEDVTPE
jgi:hypothetical protein